MFAEHGFDGARIDAIAKASGYNKSLIFQYFGDKLGLYAAVIRRADEQTRTWQNEALRQLSATEPDKSVDQIKNLLAMYVGKYFDYLVEHPHVAAYLQLGDGRRLADVFEDLDAARFSRCG